MTRIRYFLNKGYYRAVNTYKIEGKVLVVLVIPASQDDKNRRELFITLVYVKSVEILDRFDMEKARFWVRRELLRRQIHQPHFLHPLLIDHNLRVKVIREADEHFLFPQAVAKKEDSVLFMRFHNVHQTLVCFLSGWEIVARICERVIQMQVIN